MPINYYLQPNPITPDPNDHSARIMPHAVLDVEAIVKEMTRRGTGVTETDIRAALNLFFEVVSDEIAEGNYVNLPVANIKPSISGTFTSATDTFDESRHVRKVSVSGGMLVQEKVKRASVEKVLQGLPSPVLLEYADINSTTTNSKATPGGIGSITGEELKFNPDNAAEGIFFVSNGTATRVTVMANRTEGNLMFSVPALAPGSYTLEVRKGYASGKSIRTGALSDLVLVS